ncbi:tRNA (cytidine(34)-2'-O)-methyltransferase [Thiomicrorhabdus heinhorstiae]|uniref:tRNA (cytidine(34)-2'-O)-methyltransferase n=1 Tax=Thiomicrorhabdus heinhorstiae TaxID=2748010 RepID=A0ABS0C1U9_9GAMM|nr:tRNA (cytidine(34)-2'-O)-methyltransferase [Thiomicrorhabdus heinhorstiae]MBF6059076.1 tRNA (cytidine(34)-2'-O)-methyltransferase [Thiomicrorhabdus heinhorstiae]
MLHIILYEPEIPQNTGALIRLSANMGAHLHLIHPIMFDLSEKKVRRAGLDYAELAKVHEHANLQACLETIKPNRVFALTTKTTRYYTEPEFENGDAFLFGPESRGLPMEIIESLPFEQRLTIPMIPGGRSLNLANAVSVVAYEAWRQLDFTPNL